MSSQDHKSTRNTLMVTTAVTGTSSVVAGITILTKGILISGLLSVAFPLILLVSGIYFFFKSWGSFSKTEYSNANMSAWIGSILSIIAALWFFF
jgi:hypothetical protein